MGGAISGVVTAVGTAMGDASAVAVAVVLQALSSSDSRVVLNNARINAPL